MVAPSGTLRRESVSVARPWGRGHVEPDLVDQGLARGEAPLVADLADQLELDGLAVELEVDAGDVDLEQRPLGLGAGERGPRADVGHRREPLPPQ
jgi:hypothetical protein